MTCFGLGRDWSALLKTSEDKSGEKEKRTEIKGVLFVPHTEKSELSKRIREKLKAFETVSALRIKVIERTGEKLVEVLHKSNPWEDTNCGREDCKFCMLCEKPIEDDG